MATAACVLLVAGCNRGAPKQDGREDLLKPDFPAESTEPPSTVAPGSPGTSALASGGATSTTATPTRPADAPPAQVPAPAIAGATTAAVADRIGDLTPSPLDPPPPWADLAGATMIRRADGFELRIRLGGGTAPSTTDEDHTMNIASFYDINGDGDIDFEVWANLASSGWGSSYFDNVKRRAYFAEKSGVKVVAEGPEVVLRFPLSHVGNAERFRWALGSEWGRYEVLSTEATARDDAPDNDAAARFPS